MAFVWKKNYTKLRRFGDWQCVEVLFNEGDTVATVVLDKDLQEVCLGSIQPLEKILMDFIPWKELGLQRAAMGKGGCMGTASS